jgi:ABC-type glycerol-3-phosphate transport system substrate-binding protein
MSKQLLITLLLIGVMIAGCGGSDEATPTPAATSVSPAETNSEDDERTTIRFAVYDFEQGRYQDLVDAFEAENRDIHIELESINEILGMEMFGQEDWPDDAYLTLAAAADVIAASASRAAVQQGALLDLTSLMANDANFDPADFYPALLEQYQWRGGTWSLPTEVNYEMIYFDKDAFDEAGVPYPQVGWTWDDFLATAKALTQREGEEVTRWGFVEPFPNPLLFIQGQAGSPFNPDGDPPTVRLDDPAVIAAVEWYTNLFLREEVSPYYSREGEGGRRIAEGFQDIEGGRAAMWNESFSAWEFRREQGNIGVVPWPVDGPSSGSSSQTTPATTTALSISAGTASPEAAWRWLDFLSHQSNQPGEGEGEGNIRIVGMGGMWARRSVAEASGFWDRQGEEMATALRFATEHAFTPLYDAVGMDAGREALTAILEDGQPVADALAEAQTAAEEAIETELAGQAEATPVPDFAVAADETETEGQIEIDFMSVAGGPFSLETFRTLAEQFEAAHPDIEVNFITPNFINGGAGLEGMAADADCFQWFPGFDNANNAAAVLNLEPFFDNDPTITKEDFFPAILDQFRYQGQVYGLPADITMTVIEYNKNLFDAAGLEYPSADWATEDFLAAAVALTQGEGEAKQYGFVPELFEPNDMLTMMERMGATLVDDSQSPPAITFTDPATIEAMRWYTSLTTEYGVKPTFITNLGESDFETVQDRQTLINTGRAAMWTVAGMGGGPGIMFVGGPEEEERDTSHIGVVPLPAGPDGSGGGYSSANGYFISATTDARLACWEWIKFLTEQPSAATGLPGRRSVAESAAYRQLVGEERANAYLATLAEGGQPSFFQRFTDDNSWLGISFIWLARAYDQVLNEGRTIEEALQSVQDIADAYRACIIAADAFTDQAAQQECLQEVDEDLPGFFAAPVN